MLGSQTDYVSSGGAGGFGFGGGWGIPPVGLFGVIGGFGNRGFGFDGDGRGRHGIDEACAIRADIGETKFKVAEIGNAISNQILESQISNKENTFQLEREMFGLQRDVLGCCCETQKTVLAGDNALEKSILNQGWSTKLEACQNTNQLQKSIDECCCNTNLNIERTASQTQYRDLENRCHIDAELAKLACGQKEIMAFIVAQGKDNKIECLEKELRQAERRLDRCDDQRIAGRTNCLVTQLGDANRAFFGPTFPWSIPVCGSSCGCF